MGMQRLDANMWDLHFAWDDAYTAAYYRVKSKASGVSWLPSG